MVPVSRCVHDRRPVEESVQDPLQKSTYIFKTLRVGLWVGICDPGYNILQILDKTVC